MGKKLFIFLIVVGLYKWWSAPETISLPNAKFDIEYIKHCHNPLGLSAPLPLVIALHGNGDYPDNFYEYVFDGLDISACFILPYAPTKYGRGYAWPYDKAELDLQSAALAEFSHILQLKHQSPSKPALLGFSGGGFVGVGDPYLFTTIAAVVIGGTSLLGGQGGYGSTVVGALVLTVLTSLLVGLGLSYAMQQSVFGLLIIL